jgi:hypothetical protein
MQTEPSEKRIETGRSVLVVRNERAFPNPQKMG